MTIKEIETLSGLARANIRFYEEEGLLTPARSENGYRDYSENDLEVLKKIKLLRMLHISLEEIKALQKGEQELSVALDKHIAKLAADKADIERSQQICREMREDGATYATLDAQKYLTTMRTNENVALGEITRDIVPRPYIPWRRYLARSLDLFLYEVIWLLFVAFVFNMQVTNRAGAESLLDTFVSLLIMLAVEPLLLSRCGTTLGKWILGIRVTDNDGVKLSYSDAFSRTKTVIWKGMACGIPFYSLWREYKSYVGYADGETLDWEYDSEITVKDKANWRGVVYAVVYVAVGFLFAIGVSFSELPQNRGDITVAEFCENYNHYISYYGYEPEYILDSNGDWEKRDTENSVTVYVGDEVPRPELSFTEENGYVTAVCLQQTLSGSETWAPAYQTERNLMLMAFALTQDGIDVNKKEVQAVINKISEEPFESFEYEAYGVTISCDISYSGYSMANSLGVLIPEEGVETEYTLRFSMEK